MATQLDLFTPETKALSVVLDTGITFCGQSGWQPIHPKQICQKTEPLLACTTYTFNLDDAQFRQSFVARYGVNLFSTFPSWFPPDPYANSEYEQWLLTSDDYRHQVESGLPVNQRQLVSHKDRLTAVRCVRLARGQLQCAWDLYVKFENPTAVPAEPWSSDRV